MKKVLIGSFDMEVGGVERSLISMLNNFDHDNHEIDLMLYSHTGDFMTLLNNKVNLLKEDRKYSTFRKSIVETFKQGNILLGSSRILARIFANLKGKINKTNEYGVYQMQLMWKYALPFLPKIEKEYDVAISYLWPHYFIAEKIKAREKIAWIHTDYSTIETDVNLDLKMWDKFDHIIAVSEECKNAFLIKYPILKEKIKVIENITSPDFIKKMAEENIEEIWEENVFKILSVARLSHAKGIDRAVKALKILHERGLTNIKWYVVGYGGDEEIIRKLIEENNLQESFILLGKKVNPYPYMKRCDLYVQPSRYEGKAVTVGEAQILGKPVMITNYTTAKSQVKEDFDGYICDSTIEGITDGIEKLFGDKALRDKLAYNCKKSDYRNSNELNKLYDLIN
ncbi:glycosyltransferase [Clostridium perfringens]|uniref:Capsular polysaccharide biosynthsis protein n=1 Tax=Clostridium perfringens E str. JGS1987 TaxID=451755 RepID=B1BNI2_CLOPF|nr:glycosyltransferase [Clostridium perfringens]EDT16709.1 capsular polysaccharide biosynthsis protein [Clostridium perfringens E str. JGS1987]EHK2306090.1 glycosyltransferase [Clostridium perfringens]EJT6501183.1 glycosyltransferase [Clostridium perfringens]EJT6558961.1 glycosyltransferase [Clostridium perfringens]EJT6560091.1 glycosyltransferase [Clostridium perfringens]